MFPLQTSLIPVTVAFAEFVAANGLYAFSSYYQNWYLGVQFRYLTGPITPILLMLIQKAFPGLSFFDVSIILVFIFYFVSVMGWSILASQLGKNKKIGLVIAVLLILLPWRLFSTLALSELSVTFSKSLLPWIIIVFHRYLKKQTSHFAALSIFSVTALLLVDIAVIPVLFVGFISAILSISIKKGKFWHASNYVKPTLLVVSFAIMLATLWYGVGYWKTILTNPSIGGRTGFGALFTFFDFAKASLPVVLGFSVVYIWAKVKSRLSAFTSSWLLAFGLLTLFRFIGDPDFWMDWTSWFYEVEIGIALLVSRYVVNAPTITRRLVAFAAAAFVSTTLVIFITQRLGRPTLISTRPPDEINSLDKLNEIVTPSDRVFLSGATVFWADGLASINQVRGGVDRVATHPLWNHAAYQLREGTNADLAYDWLKVLGVKYVLVHTRQSSEYFHDFKNVGKWRRIGKNIWEEAGDIIYEIKDTGIAWEVDSNIADVVAPSNGETSKELSEYLSYFKQPLKVARSGNNITVKTDEKVDTVLLIVSYWKSAKVVDDQNNDLSIKRDKFGHTIIMAKGTKEITIEY